MLGTNSSIGPELRLVTKCNSADAATPEVGRPLQCGQRITGDQLLFDPGHPTLLNVLSGFERAKERRVHRPLGDKTGDGVGGDLAELRPTIRSVAVEAKHLVPTYRLILRSAPSSRLEIEA